VSKSYGGKIGRYRGGGYEHQQLREPRRVRSLVKSTDQRGTVSVGSGEHVEKLLSHRLASGGDDASRSLHRLSGDHTAR
jgi:hypothetical protein